MTGDTELDAMRDALVALQPLETEAQIRTVRWLVDKLGLGSSFVSGRGAAKGDPSTPCSAASEMPATVLDVKSAGATWAKQYGVTASELESVFHFEGNKTTLIAAHVPGKNNREKVLNCYILSGITEFLGAGETAFSDKSARSLCEQFGCLDTTNHSKYLNEKGNEFTGSKEKGWTLTAPGKRRAAQLVKEIASTGS